MESARNIGRRQFLLGSALLGTGAMAAAAGCTASGSTGESASAASSDAAEESTLPYPDIVAPDEVGETLECDVCVVGAGISGLAATVQAAELGLNTICLEKGSAAGGNGAGTEGVFAINSKYQRELGIEITPADIVSAELEESQWRGDGSLWLDMCENSADNIDWLEEHGVKFSGTVDNYYTGLFATMHWFEENDGTMGQSAYVEPMAQAAEDAGATIRCNTQGYMLIQDDQGTVTGLYAKDASTGESIRINAGAVVLASGGIGGNPDLLRQQGWQEYNIEHKITMCSPSVEGDGYKMARNAGAKDYLPLSCDQAFIGIEAVGTDQTPPYSSALNGANGIAGCGMALWVNQEGLRFNNEAINSVNLAAPEAACCRNNKAAYAIFDQTTVDSLITDEADLSVLQAAVEGDTAFESIASADDFATLAEGFGIDPDVLAEQVERYNAYCESGADLDFGKDPQFLSALVTPPYYMARLVPLFVVIIGGLYTNIRAEVLDESLDAIPGLYAAGLEGAMLHKNVYTQNMPGSNMGNNVNSGRKAARNAAEYLEQR